MYPVTQVTLPAGFDTLVKPQTTLSFTPQQVASERQTGLAHGNAPSAAKPSRADAGPVRRYAAVRCRAGGVSGAVV
ncbi:hypothetical protein IE993_25675 [Klebsiella pneumoniae]|nr:hypothetical protein [Klebsiella pneumoniae]